jgi:VWFA-related protein
MRRPIAALCFMFVSFGGSRARAVTQDQESIQLNGDLIEVRVVVTDKRGRTRENLTRDDFEILDDGKPQEIAFFSVERTSGSANAEGLETGAPGAGSTARVPVSRSIVCFLDLVHMRPESVNRARKALREFVNTKLANGDAMAVVASGLTSSAAQLTRDCAALRDAIDRTAAVPSPVRRGAFTPYLAAAVLGEHDRSALDAATKIVQLKEGLPREQAEKLVRSFATEILAEAAIRRRATLANLRAVVTQLESAPGQRLLAFISDGFTLAD